MSERITWPDRTDASTPVGGTAEADKTIFNTIKSAVNSHADDILELQTINENGIPITQLIAPTIINLIKSDSQVDLIFNNPNTILYELMT